MSGEDTPSAPSPSAVTSLRLIPGFRNLWVGQFLSDLGSNVMLLAYPLLILALTHSAVIAGAIGSARVVVGFVLRLPAGALADRLDRRYTMIVSDTVRALAMALLAILVLTHKATWPVVLVVLVLDSAASAIFDPAATAALPSIVPSPQLESAWAATEGRTYAANLGGPHSGVCSLRSVVPYHSLPTPSPTPYRSQQWLAFAAASVLIE